MERVKCRCRACGAPFGDFGNLWTQIGRSYFSPIVTLQAGQNVVPHGSVRVGDRDTLVEDWCDTLVTGRTLSNDITDRSSRLQDIACGGCHVIVGLECVSAPTNHVLDQKQLLLRLASVMAMDALKDTEVEPNITRYLKLREPSGTAAAQRSVSLESSGSATEHRYSRSSSLDEAASPSGPDMSHIQAEIEAQRHDINRIDNAAYQIVSVIDNAVGRIERELNGLKGTMQDLKDAHSGTQDGLASLKTGLEDVRQLAQDTTVISRLDGSIQTTSNLVQELRGELGTTSSQFRKELEGVKADLQQVKADMEGLRGVAIGSVAAAKDQAKEITALRNELARLRMQMDQDRENAPNTAETAFPSRELDILTSNIAKIGNRASQVEMLQMELDILKGRVGRVESQHANAVNRRLSSRAAGDPTSAFYRHESIESPMVPASGTWRRKRHSSGLTTGSADDASASKRLTFLSGHADTPPGRYEVPTTCPEVAPLETATGDADPESRTDRNKEVRLTRSGAIDKRTLNRRGARKSIGGQ